MKHRITLSIALVLCIFFSLVSLPSTAKATESVYVADTGIITLGPNQKLRVTVLASVTDLILDPFNVRFKRVIYVGGDNGTLRVASQNTTDPVILHSGEAASIDIQSNSSGVRVMVLSNSPNMRVTAMIIDTNTGKVTEVTGIGMEVTVIE